MELLYGRPDHRPSDPINPTRPTRKKTRPDQVTGQVRAEIFDPKFKKYPIQPENYTQNYAPTRPDPTMSLARHGPIFFDPKPEVIRPDPTDNDAYFMDHVNARRVIRKCKCANALNHMHAMSTESNMLYCLRGG